MSWTGDWPDEVRGDGPDTTTAEKPPTLTTEIWAGMIASDRDEWREGQLALQVEHAFTQVGMEKRMAELEELVFAIATNLSRVMRTTNREEDEQ